MGKGEAEGKHAEEEGNGLRSATVMRVTARCRVS